MIAGVEGVERSGNVPKSLYIYHPTKNRNQISDLMLNQSIVYYRAYNGHVAKLILSILSCLFRTCGY